VGDAAGDIKGEGLTGAFELLPGSTAQAATARVAKTMASAKAVYLIVFIRIPLLMFI
jgi:hypothetical protein